ARISPTKRLQPHSGGLFFASSLTWPCATRRRVDPAPVQRQAPWPELELVQRPEQPAGGVAAPFLLANTFLPQAPWPDRIRNMATQNNLTADVGSGSLPD